MEQQTKIKVPGLGIATIDFVECDGCGSKATEDSAINWRTVEPFGIEASTMKQGPTPNVQHYCGVKCLRSSAT